MLTQSPGRLTTWPAPTQSAAPLNIGDILSKWVSSTMLECHTDNLLGKDLQCSTVWEGPLEIFVVALLRSIVCTLHSWHQDWQRMDLLGSPFAFTNFLWLDLFTYLPNAIHVLVAHKNKKILFERMNSLFNFEMELFPNNFIKFSSSCQMRGNISGHH